jgi:hypothetical protein
MQKRRTATCAGAAVLAALALAAWWPPLAAARGQARPSSLGPGATPAPVFDAFSADLVIRQAVVDAEGRPAGPAAPGITMRMARRQESGRWRTTMTVINREQPDIRGLVSAAINPFEVVRVEYDEDGKPPRLYDRQGRLIRPPGPADRRHFHTPAAIAAGLPAFESRKGLVPPPAPLTGQQWIAAVMAPPGERMERSAALERQLGRPIGQVRGLDRYAGWLGTDALEVLVDPGEVLPVEINRTRNSVLIARTTVAHTRAADGTLTRRAARVERLHADGSGERTVTDVEMINIRLTGGGAE